MLWSEIILSRENIDRLVNYRTLINRNYKPVF